MRNKINISSLYSTLIYQLNKMDSSKLISFAGRRYEKLNVVNPLNTQERFRMYNSIEVQPAFRKSEEKKPTMQTIDRQKKDSFILRYQKQMVVNTNYKINEELVHPSPRSQKFQKGQFTRIIGDVRDEDYSLPLVEGSDKRCVKAFVTLPHQKSILVAHDLSKNNSKNYHVNFAKQLSREKFSQSADLKKVNSIRSTIQSERGFPEEQKITHKRNRRKKNLQLHDALKKIRNFDHDIGHRYGELLFTPKNVPEFYNRELRESPKGHVKFSSFRQKIGTRYDRIDPYWGMNINYEDSHQNPQWKSGNSIKMEKISQRKINQVFSKYPIRQAMNLITPKNLSPEKNSRIFHDNK